MFSSIRPTKTFNPPFKKDHTNQTNQDTTFREASNSLQVPFSKQKIAFKGPAKRAVTCPANNDNLKRAKPGPDDDELNNILESMKMLLLDSDIEK
jgi:hypothetical protein